MRIYGGRRRPPEGRLELQMSEKASNTIGHRRFRWLVATALAVTFAVAPTAYAQGTDTGASADADESIVLNFESADIREVIYSLASALGINYWIDPRVQGQITVRTTGRIDRADLFPVFHQLLRNNGFAAVKVGDIYNIVPAEDGKTRVVMPGHLGSRAENHFVMELVKVHHVGAEQMATTIGPFVTPGGDVLAYPRSNLVVITDIADNAARLADMVRTFDTDTFKEMNARVYTVKHAVLEDLTAELQSILEAYHVIESGAGVFLIPLLRLNAIAVIAFDASIHMQIEHWLNVLDVESDNGSRRQVYVYRVENSKAADLSGVLNEIYSDGGGSGGSTRRARSGEAAESGLGLGGGLSRRRGDRGGGDADGETTRGRRGGSSGGGASGLVLGGGDSENSDLFEQEVRLVEDEITNSLVILATPRDYQTIRQVLVDLDIVPRQVLIEVMIAEISLNEAETFGVNQQLIGTNTSSNADSSTATTDDQGGTFFDLFGEEVRLIGNLGSSGLSGTVSHFRDGVEVYKAVIDANRSQGRIKVLSRPHIMTSDNQEARILIGQEVPIITSQSDTDVVSNNSTRFLQNVQYRDTGVIISVLPQVNSEGLVNLQIQNEVSEIDNSTNDATADISSPTFRTREAETTVVVSSGETIVIGGIISETSNENRSGVPYLMNLPVIGRYFRSSSQDLRRTELIILITPFVVRDREEAKSVTEEFKRRVDNVLRELEGAQPEKVDAHHTMILESNR
ncbi:MAG: general secretion pathway protein D [Hyphomicrobiaceae bacterium]|jgi:general secretion pathway protein D